MAVVLQGRPSTAEAPRGLLGGAPVGRSVLWPSFESVRSSTRASSGRWARCRLLPFVQHFMQHLAAGPYGSSRTKSESLSVVDGTMEAQLLPAASSACCAYSPSTDEYPRQPLAPALALRRGHRRSLVRTFARLGRLLSTPRPRALAPCACRKQHRTHWCWRKLRPGGLRRVWRDGYRYSKAAFGTVDLVPLEGSQRALIGGLDRERG